MAKIFLTYRSANFLMNKWEVYPTELYALIITSSDLPAYQIIGGTKIQKFVPSTQVEIEVEKIVPGLLFKHDDIIRLENQYELTDKGDATDVRADKNETSSEILEMVPYVPKNNINKISGIVSEQCGNIYEHCETRQDMSAPTVVVSITQDVDQVSESISGQEGHILQRLVPTFSFYLIGDFAWIGEQGKEISFKIVNGLKYIHFLLQYYQDSYQPITVYHLGITQEIGNMVTNNTQPKIENKLYDFCQDKKQRIVAEKLINKLEIEIDNPSISPLEKFEKEDRIEKLKDALKEIPIRNPKSEKENMRRTVQKNIKRALDKIHEKLPELERYLNKGTIKTGDWCSYSPIPSDPVEWKLFRE